MKYVGPSISKQHIDHNGTIVVKVSKGAKIRNRYYQVPHLTQDTKGKVTNSQVRHHKQEPKGQPFPNR